MTSRLRILTDDHISRVLNLNELLDVVAEGIVAQYRGEAIRPPRPHLPLGFSDRSEAPLGMGLVMPAYVYGSAYMVTKLVGVFENNHARNLPTIHGSIVLLDAENGQTIALLDGTRITNARTGCVGGLAVKSLCEGPIRLGIIGAGEQARWQAKAIGSAAHVSNIRIYSPSKSRINCAKELSASGFDVTPVSTPAEAVADADVIVTATTSNNPVFPPNSLREKAVVIAIGAYREDMQEIHPNIVENAAQIFADVPSEVAEIGDIRKSAVDPTTMSPLGGLLAGDVSRTDDGIILVESVGSAIFDAVTSEHVHDRAAAQDLGVTYPFHSQP